MGLFEQDLAWFEIEKLDFFKQQIESRWRCELLSRREDVMGLVRTAQRIPKDTEFGLRHPGLLAVPVEYDMTDLIGKCASGAALATNHKQNGLIIPLWIAMVIDLVTIFHDKLPWLFKVT